MRVGEAIRDASAGLWRNQWMWLPLAAMWAVSALLYGVDQVLPAVGSALNYIEGLALPAFLAWWVAWAQDAAQGRRIRPEDLGPTLQRAVPGMYTIFFLYFIAQFLLGRIIPGAALLLVLAAIAGNPWIDFAAEGDVRWERRQARLRDPSYWLVAGTGLLLAAVWAWGLSGGTLPASTAVLPFAYPPISLGTALAYVATTWLWAVRARLLGDSGVFQSRRMRDFLRRSQMRDDGWE